MKGPGDYGRYDDDPEHIGCPRAQSDMTPCIARDGASALADEGDCVACYRRPADLLTELLDELDMPAASGPTRRSPPIAANRLRDLVRDTTRPR